ncbi:MAG: OB-fold nucleic acid binding domain-containing protein, partial [Bacilli bacterium]|nr:OB-fold nucleic acid binding domain-containing protein [Bacilli bacterium]
MKKLLSFLFLLISAFALAGCSLLGGGGSGNGGNTTITVDFDEVFETISAQIPDKDNITADISLIRELGDVDITWTSSDESIISTRGRVARPDTDTEVILKCKLQANGITKEYTIRVLVRAEEVLKLSSIIDVINGETGKTYKVRGTVVAFSRINFILQDSTGYIISYFDKGVVKPVRLGDVLELEGVTSTYGGATQFNAPTYTLVGTENVKQPSPRVLDANSFDALNQSKIQIEYVELSGRLIKSGDYYNIQVPEATNVGSIAKPDNDLAEFIDKNVKVTGYFAYVSGGRYLYLVYTDIVLGDNTTPPVEVTTKTISEIKALGLSEVCKLEGTVVATTNTSFVVKDETGLILVYGDTAYAKDLNIGEKVKVEGITAEYGGIRQIANPEYEVIAEGPYTQPNPRVLDKDAFMALATKTEIEYIELEATLRKSGNYINLDVKDATMKGSILACDKDFTEFIDKTVKVQGYFVYVSGSSTKYANIALINIALSENQNPETLSEVTLATVKSGTVGETYLSRGVVVATSAQSVLLKDASAYMYVYLGNTYAKDLNVGDEITVKGATSTYNGAVQFNRPTYEKVATSTVADPTARVLNTEDIDTLYTATTAPEVEFVEVTGIAKKSGNYLNVEFEGTVIQASIVYPEFDSATINNKQVKFTGYYLYNSKNSSGTFINIICTAYEEVGTVEPPVLESSLISAVIAGEVGATYKTQGTIIAMNKNTLVIDDASAKMTAYFAEGYDETLVIGDVVEVIGATTLYGGSVQFSSPEFEKKEHTEYSDPIANTIDADGFTALKQERVTIQYVAFSGVLKISGNYANVEVAGSELIGSLTSKTIDFTAFDNKHIKVTGYFTNYSGSNGQYLNIIVTAIEEEIIEGNELFDEIKAEILAWNNANIYASMVLPTGDDSYTISWRSSNEAVFSSTGVVTAPTEDTVVTMTATLTVGTKTEEITFDVNICALSDIAT